MNFQTILKDVSEFTKMSTVTCEVSLLWYGYETEEKYQIPTHTYMYLHFFPYKILFWTMYIHQDTFTESRYIKKDQNYNWIDKNWYTHSKVFTSKIKSTNIRIILFAHILYKLKDVLCKASLKSYNIRSLS